MKRTADVIRALREDRDLKQVDVAKYLGITQQVYSSYEQGKHELPSRYLLPLAQLYEVNAEYLLGSTDYMRSISFLKETFTEEVSLGEICSVLLSLDLQERHMAASYIEYLFEKQKKNKGKK